MLFTFCSCYGVTDVKVGLKKLISSAVLELLEKKGSYEVKMQSVEEFGQKRSLLAVTSEGKIGKEAKTMERLVLAAYSA